MIDSSKVAFVKKILKEQKFANEISSTNFNDGKSRLRRSVLDSSVFLSENDCQVEKSFNQSSENLLVVHSRNRYNRGFVNDLLSFLKHFIPPRFVDMK